MHRDRLLLAMLVSFMFVSVANADESDQKRLQGTWVVESAEIEGKPTESFKGATLTFKGEIAVMQSKLPSGRTDVDENPYELEVSKTPKRITLFQKVDREKGVQRGIYDIQADTLKICMSGPGAKEYPADFKAKGCLVLILKVQQN